MIKKADDYDPINPQVVRFIGADDKIIDVNTKNYISLQDKIAQMIMVRIDGNFYNNDSWKKNEEGKSDNISR